MSRHYVIRILAETLQIATAWLRFQSLKLLTPPPTTNPLACLLTSDLCIHSIEQQS